MAWAAKDRGELQRFLTRNLSLPNSTAELLLGSSIDLHEVGDSLWYLVTAFGRWVVASGRWVTAQCCRAGLCRGLHCPREWGTRLRWELVNTWPGLIPPPHARVLLGTRVPLLLARSAAPLLSPVQVYRLFFGSFPLVPDETHERDLWDGFGPGEKMTQLEVRSGAMCGRLGGAELILSSVSHPRVTWGVHPGRGDVTGCCQVARAAAGMAGSSVSHCSG